MQTPTPAPDCGFTCSTAFYVLFGLVCAFVCVCARVIDGTCDDCLGIRKKPVPQQSQHPIPNYHYYQPYPGLPV